jgi:hypothetical protein
MLDIPLGTIGSAIITALITAGATVLAVILANRLGYARSYKEKLWDLQLPAYGRVLSELTAIEQICDSADEYIDQDEDRYFESVEQKDNAKIADHFKIIDQRMADDYLIFSDNFIALFDEMKKEMAGDPYDYDPPADHKKFAAAIRQYRPRLIALAKGEITIRGKRPFWRL